MSLRAQLAGLTCSNEAIATLHSQGGGAVVFPDVLVGSPGTLIDAFADEGDEVFLAFMCDTSIEPTSRRTFAIVPVTMSFTPPEGRSVTPLRVVRRVAPNGITIHLAVYEVHDVGN